LKFGPKFLENGELWSTYFGILKSFLKGLQDVKSLWVKVQKQKSYGGQTLTMISIFSKLMNFGPHILTFFESLREGLQAAKFRNKKVIG